MKSLLDFHTSEHWDAVGLAGEMVIHPISGSKSQQRSNPVSVDRWCLLGQGCRGCCTNTRSVQAFPSVSTRLGYCTPHTQQCNTTAIRSPSTQHAESTQYMIVTEKLSASQDFEYPECYGQEIPWFRPVKWIWVVLTAEPLVSLTRP